MDWRNGVAYLRLTKYKRLTRTKIIMIKYFYILIFFLVLSASIFINTLQAKIIPVQKVKGKINQVQDTLYIINWLTKVITDYVNNEDLKIADKNLQKDLTVDYYNYKMDAITLEYSDMTKLDFHNKWKSKYNTKLVGNGGFFTSVIDHGNVKVKLCRLLKTERSNVNIYYTIVHDLRWKTDYKFYIKVIYKDKKLFIDDIQEQKYSR